MKSYQFVLTNSPAIFFLFAMALITWDIKQQIRREKLLAHQMSQTPKFPSTK